MGAEKGVALTQAALVSSLGEWSNILLSIIIFLLAFTSIIGNYYYGESNVEFITERTAVLQGFRVLVLIALFGGAIASADIIWNSADAIMGIMALVNLTTIALLSGTAFRLLRDYSRQRREGRDPVFTRDLLPDLDGIQVWEDERSVTGPVSTLRVPKRRTKQPPCGGSTVRVPLHIWV